MGIIKKNQHLEDAIPCCVRRGGGALSLVLPPGRGLLSAVRTACRTLMRREKELISANKRRSTGSMCVEVNQPRLSKAVRNGLGANRCLPPAATLTPCLLRSIAGQKASI